MQISLGPLRGSAKGAEPVRQLANVTLSRVELEREQLLQREKTKRILILAVCILFVIAALVMTYAPEGKKYIGYVMGSVLIVLALGAIGASRFILKTPVVELDTSSTQHSAASRAMDTSDVGWTSEGCNPSAPLPDRPPDEHQGEP